MRSKNKTRKTTRQPRPKQSAGDRQQAHPQGKEYQPAHPKTAGAEQAGIMLNRGLPAQRSNRSVRQAAVLQLQRRYGNSYVQRLMKQRAATAQSPTSEALGPVQREAGVQDTMLRWGSLGQAVKVLQQLLNANGAHPALDVDGAFGPGTRAAVLRFQMGHGLDADGVVGSQTWAALRGTTTGGEMEAVAGPGGTTVPGAETPIDEAKKGFPKAVALYKAGQYAAALVLFERYYGLPELKQSVRRSMAWNMGACHLRLGNREQAVAMFQEYLLFPGGDQEKAMEYIRRARTGEELPAVDQDLPAVTPEQRVAADAQAQHEIGAGDSVGKGGDYQGALDHYRVAYGLRAASPHWRRKAASRMGHAYHYLDRFDQAIDMFQEVLGFPGATDEERVLMLDYIRQARKGPIESTEPSTSMTKEEMKAKYELGEAAFENGQYATALAIWKELYMLRDASPEIRRCMAFNMGICHQRLQQFAEAISLFEESLLFPNVSSESRRKALERIRQARKGELGPNLRPGEAAPGAAPGAPWVLFAGMVYFETGRSDVGSLGQVTITQLGRLLKQRHNAEPALTFLIELVGASSSRWRGAGGSEQAKQLNEQLAQQRAASVEAKLGTVLPAADLAAGVYQIDPDAEGDQLSENLGLDSDDNTWTLRNVALTVWASGASTQGGQ